MFKTTFKILLASSAMVSAIAVFNVDADAADARRLSAMKASPALMKAARGQSTVRRTLPNKIARTTGPSQIKGLSARVKSGPVGPVRKLGNSRLQITGNSRIQALQKQVSPSLNKTFGTQQTHAAYALKDPKTAPVFMQRDPNKRVGLPSLPKPNWPECTYCSGGSGW